MEGVGESDMEDFFEFDGFELQAFSGQRSCIGHGEQRLSPRFSSTCQTSAARGTSFAAPVTVAPSKSREMMAPFISRGVGRRPCPKEPHWETSRLLGQMPASATRRSSLSLWRPGGTRRRQSLNASVWAPLLQVPEEAQLSEARAHRKASVGRPAGKDNGAGKQLLSLLRGGLVLNDYDCRVCPFRLNVAGCCVFEVFVPRSSRLTRRGCSRIRLPSPRLAEEAVLVLGLGRLSELLLLQGSISFPPADEASEWWPDSAWEWQGWDSNWWAYPQADARSAQRGSGGYRSRGKKAW
ncbi:unnamed protein product [Symbiodinium microadriaticum]|nr:unnamed protein product [Symbiodinium microadriaticum]